MCCVDVSYCTNSANYLANNNNNSIITIIIKLNCTQFFNARCKVYVFDKLKQSVKRPGHNKCVLHLQDILNVSEII